MTVQELYEWAKTNGAEHFDIEIQYCDAGGDYSGAHDCKPYILKRQIEGHTEKVVNL